MKLSEKITAAEESLVRVKDQLVEATKALEASPDEEDLLAQVEELSAKVEKETSTVAALKRAETALAAKVEPPVEANPGVGTPAFIKNSLNRDPKEPGDVIFKHAAAQFLAFVERKPVAQVMDERYGNTNYVKETFDAVRKSQIDPATTTGAGWAAELVQSDTRGFINTLKDVSVAAALGSRATMLEFGGYQSVKIPRRNPLAGTPTEPAWVAEGRPIPLTKFSFGSTELFRYKLAAITTWTEELAERAMPAIEDILRDAMREAYAEVLDAALLDNGAAVTGVRPNGLLYDPFAAGAITPIAGTAGGGEDAVRADILALVSAMTAVNLGARPVLLMNELDRLSASMMTSALSEYLFKDDLTGGNLMGIPVISSNNVPQHSLILVDAAYLAMALDPPMFDVSNVATVVEASADTTAPTMVSVTASGDAGAAAGEVAPTEGIPVAGAGAGLAAAGATARSLWQTLTLSIASFCGNAVDKLRELLGSPSRVISSQAA